ncbi:Protein kinase-like domain containing protein, partial [Tylopilus felleus]
MQQSLENGQSSSLIHSLVPQDLTGRITRCDDQYCAGGSFGDVYRCKYHSEYEVKEVAVKTFRFEFIVADADTGNGRFTRMIRRELGIWKRLSHPNIVQFLGIVSGFGRLGNTSLVSVWMSNGTLQGFLQKYDDKLTVAHRLQLLLGIANGLEYLHSLSIVHGDLTSNNVLLDEKYNARLTDFGYASLVGETPEALAYLQASTLRSGTLRWAAPECILFNSEEEFRCTTKSDIYSFGNLSLQVLSGKRPWAEFRRDEAIILELAKGHRPRRPQSHPIEDQHWTFVEHCWSPVEERPSAAHLVSSTQDF